MEEASMIWNEILVSKEILDADIQSAAAEMFLTDTQSIMVVRSIADDNIDSSKPIIIESSKLGGDFPTRLVFYVEGKAVSIENIDKLDSIVFLCRRLDCQILVSDEDVNPYSMNLVESNASITKVFLDVAKLDDDGQFVIKSLV
jgi:hypothetical protein